MPTSEYKICLYCNKEFTPHLSHFNKTKYCSRLCKDRFHKARNRKWVRKAISCYAFRCTNEFVPKSPEQKYCSRECNAVSKHGAFKCLWCGCWFMSTSYRVPSNYCSTECGLKASPCNHNNNNWTKLYL